MIMAFEWQGQLRESHLISTDKHFTMKPQIRKIGLNWEVELVEDKWMRNKTSLYGFSFKQSGPHETDQKKQSFSEKVRDDSVL